MPSQSLFVEVEKVADFDLLVPFQQALAEVEEASKAIEQLDQIKKDWIVKLGKDEQAEEEEVVEDEADREKRLIKFLDWCCGEPLLLAGDASNFEEVCHVLFYFLDDIRILDKENNFSPNHSEKERLFETIAQFLCTGSHLADHKLEMCSILLNTIPSPDEVSTSRRDREEQQNHNKRWGSCRGRVFRVMLEFAKENKRGDLFRGRLSTELFDSWNVEEDLYTQLIFLSYQILKQTKDAKQEAHKFLLEYLKKRPNDTNLALRAVIDVLASERNCPRDLMEVYSLDAVRRLQNQPLSNEYSLYKLLELLYKFDVNAYQQFLAEEGNKAKLNELSLNENNLMFKIQQLTLCDLGRKEPLQKLADLQKALMCDETELERIVQAAQQQGLLEALFDYSNKTLRLHKVALRVFRGTPECWKDLSLKLDRWASQTNVIMNITHDSTGTASKI